MIHVSFVLGSTIAMLDTFRCFSGLSHLCSQHSFEHPACGAPPSCATPNTII